MKKAVLLITLMVVFLLAVGGSAFAASPQDIYNDYLQNGKLTGDYTEAELRAFLGDAGVQQYGDVAVLGALSDIVKGLLAGDKDSGDRDKFPFTGAEILLMVLGGVALVGAGAAVKLVAGRRA